MKNKWLFGAALFGSIFFTCPLLADTKALIIYPLECGTLDAQTALTANAAFEESLIKSGRYQVINEKDFQALLTAQGAMVSGLFDESQLLTIGRLLPAEQIARGTIESKGGALVIRIRLLDLATGVVLAAESAENVMLHDVGSSIRSLVFRITGMQSAAADTKFCSLTITADYKDAIVFIDGRQYGTAPLLLDNIPAGTYFVELKKDSLYYSGQLVLEKNTTVYAAMKQRFGSLIILSQPADAEITIGGTHYGKIKFAEQIPAQNQTVVLRKPGFYRQVEIPVIADKTVKIDIALNPTSTVSIIAAQAVTSHFYGENIRKEFQGSMEITDLPPGTYVIESTQPDYQSIKQTISIGNNEQIQIIPTMQLTEAAQNVIQKLADEKQALALELANIDLPEIYLEQPLPALDLLVLKNTMLTFVPLLDLLVLTDKPLLPAKEKREYQTMTFWQLSAGLLCQAGIVCLFLSKDETVRTISIVTALVSGCINLEIGIFTGAKWAKWLKPKQAAKIQYDRLNKRLTELESGN